MIIHISGPSGSGKTTLGNKLKEKFKNAITVCDMDDLRRAFIKHHYGDKKIIKFDANAYQLFINDYISKHTRKPLVFVGLNVMPWWHRSLYYDLSANYKFYIQIDYIKILEQRYDRMLNDLRDKPHNRDMLLKNSDKFIKNVSNWFADELSFKKLTAQSDMFAKNYHKQKYVFASRESIYNTVCKLLNKTLSISK